MVKSLSLIDSFKQILYSSKVEKGVIILLLVTFFPLTYKIISPIFIILGLGAYTEYINGILYCIGIMLAFLRIKNSIRATDIFLYLAFSFILWVSPLIYPMSDGFVSENMHDILLKFAVFYFLGLIVDYNRDKMLLRLVMRIAFLIAVFWQTCLLVGLVDFDSPDGTVGEQMEFAYSLLLVVMYMLIEYNNTHDKIELFAFLLGSVMILFMGTRGPVVLLGLFLAAFFLIFHKYKSHPIIKKLSIISFFLIFYFLSNPIMMSMSLIAVRLGMSSKVFDSYLSNSLINIEESSGRDTIYAEMWNAISSDSTGFGYGFGGDRLFSASNGYAHNFELEILVQFGLLGAAIIFLILSILFIRSYSKARHNNCREFWLVVFFWGFMSLQFSKSWLIHEGFFFMIGYFVTLLRNRRSTIFINE